MSNANNNPQDGWWNAGSAGPSPQPQSQSSPQSQAQSPAYQPQPNRGSRFFFWIRSSRIIRGRDRWIAGVCDGMARRLGWSTTLVRALVILTSLLFGAGAAFYALAWLLLPDETDDRILCEELINGHWDWNCLGALICAAAAICLPGVGWAAFAMAALALWLLINRQSYAAQWQQPHMPQPQSQQPPARQSGQSTQPNRPTQPTQPVAPAQPFVSTQSQYAQRQSQNNAARGPAQSPYQTFQQPVNEPAAFATDSVPPTFSAPPQDKTPQPRPKRVRRKPAGPLLVLATLGLALLAIAGTGWYATTLAIDWEYPQRLLRLATMCCGGICLGIGITIVILGCVGRRAGGLHPLAWCAAFMAVVMAFCMGMVTLESRYWQIPKDYRRVTVSGTMTWSDTSDAQMKRYERGLVISGKDYANDVLNIDLSGYPTTHGKHKVRLEDGTYSESSCPTGTLNLMAANVQVAVTLPDGCQWSVGDQDNSFSNIVDYVGGPDGLTFNNGMGWIGLFLDNSGTQHSVNGLSKGVPALAGTSDYDDFSNYDNADERDDAVKSGDAVYDGTNLDKAFKTIYDHKWYWPSIESDKAPQQPDLCINIAGTAAGSVTVQYASDSKLPLGSANAKSQHSADGKETK